MSNQYDWGEFGDVPSAYLELNPAADYYSYGEEWGTPSGQRHYQSQFQDVYNQYLGSLGGLLRQGTIPTETENTFAGFLKDYDWTEKYTALPPEMRGNFTSQFNPRTRQIYF